MAGDHVFVATDSVGGEIVRATLGVVVAGTFVAGRSVAAGGGGRVATTRLRSTVCGFAGCSGSVGNEAFIIHGSTGTLSEAIGHVATKGIRNIFVAGGVVPANRTNTDDAVWIFAGNFTGAFHFARSSVSL